MVNGNTGNFEPNQIRRANKVESQSYVDMNNNNNTLNVAPMGMNYDGNN